MGLTAWCQVLEFSAELTPPLRLEDPLPSLTSHISPSQDKLKGDLGHLL